MITIGLTGSIGMGKTTTAAMFAEEGVAVFDADAAVHALYAPGGAAVPAIENAFPQAVRDGAVDRGVLSGLVRGDDAAFAQLEAIVHPLVAQRRATFLAEAKAAGAFAVVLDVPLLFETGAEDTVDVVVVVSAPATVQRARVLARPGMTAAALDAILARQTPDSVKRARADWVIDTSQGLEAAHAQVRDLLADLKRRAETADFDA